MGLFVHQIKIATGRPVVKVFRLPCRAATNIGGKFSGNPGARGEKRLRYKSNTPITPISN
jgi:hypothetical protein